MTETISKTEVRARARRRRAALAAAMPDFAQKLATHASALAIPSGSLVGAYVALPDEADPRLLLKELAGCGFAFPRVVTKDAALVFHHWQAGQLMRPGAFGIAEPSPDWPEARPQILLVPLLAFDAHGHRLGYGGGFYDRTLEALRARGPVRAIGVAYAGQEVSDLSWGPHDQKLDAILTENGLRQFEIGPFEIGQSES